jgi:hypothetical protein
LQKYHRSSKVKGVNVTNKMLSNYKTLLPIKSNKCVSDDASSKFVLNIYNIHYIPYGNVSSQIFRFLYRNERTIVAYI